MDFIVGISIGSSKVAISLGYINKYFDIQLLGSVSKKYNGLNSGIKNREQMITAIKSCKESIEKKYDIVLDKCSLCIPSYICDLKEVESKLEISPEKGEITQDDVDKLYNDAEDVLLEGKTVLGLAYDTFIIDGKEFEGKPIGRKAVELSLKGHLILADTMYIKEYIKVVQLSDFKIESISIEPISESNFFTYDQGKKTIALINIGSAKTTINIFKHNNLVNSSYLNYGGEIITKDISRCLDIEMEEAENLKVTLGSITSNSLPFKITTNSKDKLKKTIPSDYLNQIIQARVYEIFKGVNKNLESIKHIYEVDEIILVGGGVSMFEGVVQLANEIFNCKVKSIKDISTEAYNPIHTASMGIVKESFNTIYKKKDINLFKEDNTYNKYDKKKDIEESFFTKIKSFIKDFF